AVFPCGQDKKPLVKWRDVSSTDESQVRAWWQQWPHAMPAIDLAKTDLLVIDAARHGGPDGVSAVENIFAGKADLAIVPTIRTPSGGRHHYFRQPAQPLGNSDKAVRDRGINVRGQGGYVIAAGARRQDGTGYDQDAASPELHEAIADGRIP